MPKKINKTILSLGFAIPVATVLTITNIAFLAKKYLKNLQIAHLVDPITNKEKQIPYSAKEFYDQWQNYNFSFNALIFQEYFKYTFTKNSSRILKNTKIEVKLLEDSLQIRLTYRKAYGKNEIKIFELNGFKNIPQPINPNENELFKKFVENFELNLDVKDKNKFASSVYINDLPPITDPNKNKYKLSYTFTANDYEGTLAIKVTITSKVNASLTKTVSKSFSGFKTEPLPISVHEELNRLSFDFSKYVKDNANTSLASKVISSINSFALTSTNPYFDEHKYNWKVEFNANDKEGKLYAKITMSPKNNPNEKAYKVLNDLPAIFKKYTNGEITNAMPIDGLKISSAQDVIDTLKFNKQKIDEFIKYKKPDDDEIDFLNSDFTVNGTKVTFKYKIWKEINDPKSFDDKTTKSKVQSTKVFVVDFKDNIDSSSSAIQKKLEDLKKHISLDVANKWTMLASEVTEFSKIYCSYPTLSSDYELVYEDIKTNLIPHDGFGELKVKAKLLHKASGQSVELGEKIISGFKNASYNQNLNYKPFDIDNPKIANLWKVQEIFEQTKNKSGDELKTILSQYGKFDDSNLSGINYFLDKVIENSGIGYKYDDILSLHYSFSKNIIVGKNNDGTFKNENYKFNESLELNFHFALSNAYSKRVYAYKFDVLMKNIKRKDGYDHSFLASKFDVNTHLHFPDIENKHLYDISVEIKPGSVNDYNGSLTLIYKFKVKGNWNPKYFSLKYEYEIELDGFKKP